MDRKCFFITPIGEDGSAERKNADRVWKTIQNALHPYVKKENVIRSDEEVKLGRITDHMEVELRDFLFCIADITGLNPNVMYEIGYRRGSLNPVIIISSKSTEPPFDIRDLKIIYYDSSDPDSLIALQDKIEKFAKQIVDTDERDFCNNNSDLSYYLNGLKDIKVRQENIIRILEKRVQQNSIDVSNGDSRGPSEDCYTSELKNR